MSAHEYEVRAAWRRCAGDGRSATEVLEAVLERHREPHRRYHTVAHVVWVLRHVAAISACEPVGDDGAVVAATCFHDAVYDPASGSNEADSARLAGTELGTLGWDADRVGRVTAMIERTADHVPRPSDDHDTHVLLDADLAVLGADPAAYQAYVNGVRAEYAHVDDRAWRTGRSALLDAFLERERLFCTDTAHEWFEARARANLSAERASLR